MSVKNFEALQLELKDTLDRLGCVEVKAASSRHGDVRVLFRIIDERKWLDVVQLFLSKEIGRGWYSFIGKKYFLTKEGKYVSAGVAIFESDDMDKTILEVRKIFSWAGHKNTTNEPDMVEASMPWENKFKSATEKRVKSLGPNN
jgi:hypothetical protein